MAKGKHREAQRVVLPNGMWILMYEDGSLKVAGYDRRVRVTEVLNRDGGGHVFIGIDETTESPRTIAKRDSDLVVVERSLVNALERLTGGTSPA